MPGSGDASIRASSLVEFDDGLAAGYRLIYTDGRREPLERTGDA